jgi:hypothetical protein
MIFSIKIEVQFQGNYYPFCRLLDESKRHFILSYELFLLSGSKDHLVGRGADNADHPDVKTIFDYITKNEG